MAKKIILLTMVLALSLILVACGETVTPLDSIKECVTHIDTSLLVGQNNDYRVEILTFDEKDTSEHKDASKEHVRVKLCVRDAKNAVGEYKVILSDKGSQKSQEVPLQKDVLGMSYSASLTSDVCDFKTTIVDILKDEEKVTLEMCDVLEGAKTTSDDVIEVAYNELKDSMSEYFDGDKYVGSVHVKLIHNSRVLESPYYFYVSFMKGDDVFVSCLIDPKTGSVVNKKIK